MSNILSNHKEKIQNHIQKFVAKETPVHRFFSTIVEFFKNPSYPRTAAIIAILIIGVTIPVTVTILGRTTHLLNFAYMTTGITVGGGSGCTSTPGPVPGTSKQCCGTNYCQPYYTNNTCSVTNKIVQSNVTACGYNKPTPSCSSVGGTCVSQPYYCATGLTGTCSGGGTCCNSSPGNIRARYTCDTNNGVAPHNGYTDNSTGKHMYCSYGDVCQQQPAQSLNSPCKAITSVAPVLQCGYNYGGGKTGICYFESNTPNTWTTNPSQACKDVGCSESFSLPSCPNLTAQNSSIEIENQSGGAFHTCSDITGFWGGGSSCCIVNTLPTKLSNQAATTTNNNVKTPTSSNCPDFNLSGGYDVGVTQQDCWDEASTWAPSCTNPKGYVLVPDQFTPSCHYAASTTPTGYTCVHDFGTATSPFKGANQLADQNGNPISGMYCPSDAYCHVTSGSYASNATSLCHTGTPPAFSPQCPAGAPSGSSCMTASACTAKSGYTTGSACTNNGGVCCEPNKSTPKCDPTTQDCSTVTTSNGASKACTATASQSVIGGSSTFIGYLDVAGCNIDEVGGWACDKGHSSSAVQVDFYNGPYTGSGSNFLGQTVANLSSGDQSAIDAQCGGSSPHRFNYTLPSNIRDGACHSIFAYVHGATSGVALLANSPRSATCTGPACQNGLATSFNLSIALPGIGTGNFQNSNPVHTNRYVKVDVLDASNGNKVVATAQNGTVGLGSDKKLSFSGLGAGSSLVCSNKHKVAVTIPGSLRTVVDLQYGKDASTNNLTVTPKMGDIVNASTGQIVTLGGSTFGDNTIDINDWQIMEQCRNVDPNADQQINSWGKSITFKCGDVMNLLDFPDGGTQEAINTTSGVDEWAANYNEMMRSWGSGD